MKFHFVFPREVTFEEWDWRAPSQVGIGGSETSVVAMSSGLARRGHQVTVWAPIPTDCPVENHLFGTDLAWFSIDDLSPAVLEEDGIWIIYRYPPFLDYFQDKKRVDQKLWVVCQDERYRTWAEEKDGTPVGDHRMELVDKVICLCRAHKEQTEKIWPKLKGKVVQSSNGIFSEDMEELIKGNGVKRDPNLLLYPSSPDRGLEFVLHVFERAREYNPDLKLEVAYGFNNINKIIEDNPNNVAPVVKANKEKMVREMERLGVKVLGRMPQGELWLKWLETGIWCYPTTFKETSCIVSMESQALGAVPIVTPTWAVGENVQHGFLLPGDVRENPTVLSRFVGEVTRMSLNSQWQEEIRGPMMAWALKWFNWENFVRQWEDLANGVENPVQYYQLPGKVSVSLQLLPGNS